MEDIERLRSNKKHMESNISYYQINMESNLGEYCKIIDFLNNCKYDLFNKNYDIDYNRLSACRDDLHNALNELDRILHSATGIDNCKNQLFYINKLIEHMEEE